MHTCPTENETLQTSDVNPVNVTMNVNDPAVVTRRWK